jgi:hypothetical protein
MIDDVWKRGDVRVLADDEGVNFEVVTPHPEIFLSPHHIFSIVTEFVHHILFDIPTKSHTRNQEATLSRERIANSHRTKGLFYILDSHFLQFLCLCHHLTFKFKPAILHTRGLYRR